MMFRMCENCGATLDPGEKCNCEFKCEFKHANKLKESAIKKSKEIFRDEAIAVFMFGGRIRRKK